MHKKCSDTAAKNEFTLEWNLNRIYDGEGISEMGSRNRQSRLMYRCMTSISFESDMSLMLLFHDVVQHIAVPNEKTKQIKKTCDTYRAWMGKWIWCFAKTNSNTDIFCDFVPPLLFWLPNTIIMQCFPYFQEPGWPTPSGLTEAHAHLHCQQFILTSSVYGVCARFIQPRLNPLIRDCKIDIQVMSGYTTTGT